jgi:hypothetical protein
VYRRRFEDHRHTGQAIITKWFPGLPIPNSKILTCQSTSSQIGSTWKKDNDERYRTEGHKQKVPNRYIHHKPSPNASQF